MVTLGSSVVDCEPSEASVVFSLRLDMIPLLTPVLQRVDRSLLLWVDFCLEVTVEKLTDNDCFFHTRVIETV